MAEEFDIGVGNMLKALINDIVEEAQDAHGKTPREKIRTHLKYGAGENTMHAITAMSAYGTFRAAERQAAATEALAKTVAKLQVADSVDVKGQAIVDLRQSKRDYLATTFSLPTEQLSLLWAIRGMLIDASLKALSKPDRFEPYMRVTTEEIAWTLRISSEKIIEQLPRTSSGHIDFALLEEFDIMHYTDDDDGPDNWMYGG